MPVSIFDFSCYFFSVSCIAQGAGSKGHNFFNPASFTGIIKSPHSSNSPIHCVISNVTLVDSTHTNFNGNLFAVGDSEPHRIKFRQQKVERICAHINNCHSHHTVIFGCPKILFQARNYNYI